MLKKTGRGGFLTGTITSIVPLKIQISQRLEITSTDLYITGNCIGCRGLHSHTGGICNIREPLKIGDGVLILSRLANQDGSKYILLDKIQPYKEMRDA